KPKQHHHASDALGIIIPIISRNETELNRGKNKRLHIERRPLEITQLFKKLFLNINISHTNYIVSSQKS
ncbi:MAG: hypothetical protein ACTSUE_19285, partial [Promethearchaeota archaeon]